MLGSVPAPSVLRRGDVRQVGRDLAGGVRAADRVAAGASGLHEDVAAAALGRARADRAPAAAWPSSQRFEVAVGLRDDVERHVRVLQAAELRALAAEDAGPIGLEPDRRRVARNQIALALEVRHPEAVDDVARRHLQHDRPVRAGCAVRSRSSRAGSGPRLRTGSPTTIDAR